MEFVSNIKEDEKKSNRRYDYIMEQYKENLLKQKAVRSNSEAIVDSIYRK
jgi:hypothetical protein